MSETVEFKLEPKQEEAVDLAKGPAKHILYTGGGRAGKSFTICYIILSRALMMPDSKHGIFRDTLKSCRQTLFEGTMRDVIKRAYPGLWEKCNVNKTDATITLPNGAVMMFFGLDSEERLDGILGHEFVTIWANECSKIDYAQITKLKSRLAQRVKTITGKIARTKFFYDQNPTTERHWTFKLWREKVHPSSGLPLEDPENYAHLKMTPYDNLANIAEDYISEQRGDRVNAKRFVEGDWLKEVDGALFNIEWIKRAPATFDYTKLARIVVAVDPAASSKEGSDETGVIVAGIDEDGHVYVLEDCSIRGTPEQWAKKAADAFDRWNADLIVAEKNQGGEMVELTLKTAGTALPIKLVHAARGKVLRAEPISALYAEGKVTHVQEFEKLEAQMEVFTIDFNRTKSGSPDRLDALVWALWELTQARRHQPSSAHVSTASGFY